MMIRRIIAAALVAAAPPLAAGAETCPTKADLTSGITLSSTVADIKMENRLLEHALLVTAITTYEGSEISNDMFFGHPLALPERAAGVSAQYDTPTADLDDLANTRVWVRPFTLSVGGDEVSRAEHRVELKSPGTAILSDCTYEVWLIDETVTFEDGAVRRMQKVFAPDLGLVIAEYALDSDGNPTTGLAFDQIAAE